LLNEVIAEILENPLYKNNASLPIEVTAEILENQFYKNDAVC